MNYEVIGITGTLLVLLGFLTNSENKIRAFNLAGSVVFIAYGAAIGAFSTILLNSALVIVHIAKLAKKR